jgi:hypothetical protein
MGGTHPDTIWRDTIAAFDEHQLVTWLPEHGSGQPVDYDNKSHFTTNAAQWKTVEHASLPSHSPCHQIMKERTSLVSETAALRQRGTRVLQTTLLWFVLCPGSQFVVSV